MAPPNGDWFVGSCVAAGVENADPAEVWAAPPNTNGFEDAGALVLCVEALPNPNPAAAVVADVVVEAEVELEKPVNTDAPGLPKDAAAPNVGLLSAVAAAAG